MGPELICKVLLSKAHSVRPGNGDHIVKEGLTNHHQLDKGRSKNNHKRTQHNFPSKNYNED